MFHRLPETHSWFLLFQCFTKFITVRLNLVDPILLRLISVTSEFTGSKKVDLIVIPSTGPLSQTHP